MEVYCRTIFLLAGMLFAAMQGNATDNPDTNELKFSMQSYKGHFFERCLPLAVEKKLEIVVHSPHPLRLNVHHHTETGTTYLFDMLVENDLQNVATVDTGGEYCIELTNVENRDKAYDVRLQYAVRDD